MRCEQSGEGCISAVSVSMFSCVTHIGSLSRNDLTDMTRYTDVQVRERLQKAAFIVTLHQLYTGSLKEELAVKAVAVEELILGPREAVALPSDEELYGRFQGSQ